METVEAPTLRVCLVRPCSMKDHWQIVQPLQSQ